jgi:tetratricopeptide (TPR) repeat protein
MRYFSTPLVLPPLLACCVLCSCSHDASPHRALSKEVAARQVKHEKSMKFYQQGIALMDAAKPSEALVTFKAATVADDSNGDAWMALGVVQCELEIYYEAAVSFDRASRLLPDRYEPFFNSGSVFEAVGKLPQAIDAYEAALKLSPEATEVMENLARVLIKSARNPERARTLIQRARAMEQRPEWQIWLDRQIVPLGAASPPPDDRAASAAPAAHNLKERP